jgi:hypothetical protein
MLIAIDLNTTGTAGRYPSQWRSKKELNERRDLKKLNTARKNNHMQKVTYKSGDSTHERE